MREISVRVFDDLDWVKCKERNEARSTVTIGLNGVWRELDVTLANENMIRDTLAQWMGAGREPENAPAPPSSRGRGIHADPGIVARNKALRAWCRETGLRNKSGNGWAYETSTGADYISKGLVQRYELYLASQREEGNRNDQGN